MQRRKKLKLYLEDLIICKIKYLSIFFENTEIKSQNPSVLFTKKSLKMQRLVEILLNENLKKINTFFDRYIFLDDLVKEIMVKFLVHNFKNYFS